MKNPQPTKNHFALDVLAGNRDRFTAREFRTLTNIAEHGGYHYRKQYEAADGSLPYLPSFVQKVCDKLAAIGLQVESTPACDGTGRKLYAIAQAKPDPKAAIKQTLNGFGWGVYGSCDPVNEGEE